MPDRERIDTTKDTRYVRRDDRGRFDEVVDAGRSAATDQRTPHAGSTRSGQGDRGDRPSPQSATKPSRDR